MTEKSILVSRPNHDDTLHYLCEWTQEVINEAGKNFIVHDLRGDKATAKNVTSHLKNKDYCFVILNGHGNENQIGGYQDEVIIETETNHQLLKNKIVYAVSCEAAQKLGKKCVKDGTKAYIGYSNKFSFYYDKNMYSRPLQDGYAKCVLKPSNQIPLTLLKEKTVEEAINRAKHSFLNELSKLEASTSTIGNSNMAIAILWNYFGLTARGKLDSSI